MSRPALCFCRGSKWSLKGLITQNQWTVVFKHTHTHTCGTHRGRRSAHFYRTCFQIADEAFLLYFTLQSQHNNQAIFARHTVHLFFFYAPALTHTHTYLTRPLPASTVLSLARRTTSMETAASIKNKIAVKNKRKNLLSFHGDERRCGKIQAIYSAQGASNDLRAFFLCFLEV